MVWTSLRFPIGKPKEFLVVEPTHVENINVKLDSIFARFGVNRKNVWVATIQWGICWCWSISWFPNCLFGKIISNWMFFLLSRLFFKDFYDLRNFGRFSLSLQPPMSSEAGKSFWCQGCQSPGRWQKCRVLAGLISCLFQVPFFLRCCVGTLTSILLVPFHRNIRSIGNSSTRKRRFLRGSAIVFLGRGFFVATLFWCCDLPKKKTLGSWCFLSSFQGFTKKSPMTPCKG